MIDLFDCRREKAAERYADIWNIGSDLDSWEPEYFRPVFVVVDDRAVMAGSVIRTIGSRVTVKTDCGLTVTVPAEECFDTESEAQEWLREFAVVEVRERMAA